MAGDWSLEGVFFVLPSPNRTALRGNAPGGMRGACAKNDSEVCHFVKEVCSQVGSGRNGDVCRRLWTRRSTNRGQMTQKVFDKQAPLAWLAALRLGYILSGKFPPGPKGTTKREQNLHDY